MSRADVRQFTARRVCAVIEVGKWNGSDLRLWSSDDAPVGVYRR